MPVLQCQRSHSLSPPVSPAGERRVKKDCEPTLLLCSLSKPYAFPLPLPAGKDPLFSSGVQGVYLSLSCLCHRKACETTLLRYLKVKSMKEAFVKENVREIELFGTKGRAASVSDTRKKESEERRQN